MPKESLKKGCTAHPTDGTMITGEFIDDDYCTINEILTASLSDGYLCIIPTFRIQ